VRQQFNQGDSEDPEYTTDGMMIVGTSSYELGRLEPTGSPTGWRFRVLPDPECPEGQVCFDPPPGP
jgi:hypothetical protein